MTTFLSFIQITFGIKHIRQEAKQELYNKLRMHLPHRANVYESLK